jgi:hypothetical protein
MLDSRFAADFKRASEQKWRQKSLDGAVWGFQIQPLTCWNPGLSDELITEFEAAVDARFSLDFRTFLQGMNGTDLPAIDLRGGGGEAPRFGPGFYSYPRDLEITNQRIRDLGSDRTPLKRTLEEQGFDLSDDAKLVPVYAHRYIVCQPGFDESAVLSIWDDCDAIVYGTSLAKYLEKEVFS